MGGEGVGHCDRNAFQSTITVQQQADMNLYQTWTYLIYSNYTTIIYILFLILSHT